jgi:hypothetical protein
VGGIQLAEVLRVPPPDFANAAHTEEISMKGGTALDAD